MLVERDIHNISQHRLTTRIITLKYRIDLTHLIETLLLNHSLSN